jgi:hypothetical protein
MMAGHSSWVSELLKMARGFIAMIVPSIRASRRIEKCSKMIIDVSPMPFATVFFCAACELEKGLARPVRKGENSGSDESGGQ